MRPLRLAESDIETWLGRHVPDGTIRGFARDLRRLQRREEPLSYKVLSGFGPGVGELKRGQFRLVYTNEFSGFVGVACAFRKDAKKGNAMRKEHDKKIRRGLLKLRKDEGVPSASLATIADTIH